MKQKIQTIKTIIDYRTKVGDRIGRRYGDFTYKANLLQEKNMIRMFKEIKKER